MRKSREQSRKERYERHGLSEEDVIDATYGILNRVLNRISVNLLDWPSVEGIGVGLYVLGHEGGVSGFAALSREDAIRLRNLLNQKLGESLK